jgi:hypothetical protein
MVPLLEWTAFRRFQFTSCVADHLALPMSRADVERSVICLSSRWKEDQMHKVQSQAELDELLSRFDWSHGFVREAVIVSRSYIRPDDGHVWEVAAESTPCMKLLFTFPDPDNPGQEVLFEDVESLALRFRTDLDPVGQLDAKCGNSTVAFCLRRPQQRLHSCQGLLVCGA